MTVHVVAQMRCRACGVHYLSAWPSDADTLTFQCVRCLAMTSICIVGYPVAEHRGIEELLAFHEARRALRLPTMAGATEH